MRELVHIVAAALILAIIMVALLDVGFLAYRAAEVW